MAQNVLCFMPIPSLYLPAFNILTKRGSKSNVSSGYNFPLHVCIRLNDFDETFKDTWILTSCTLLYAGVERCSFILAVSSSSVSCLFKLFNSFSSLLRSWTSISRLLSNFLRFLTLSSRSCILWDWASYTDKTVLHHKNSYPKLQSISYTNTTVTNHKYSYSKLQSRS